jgi:UDP-N-acetylmuramate dehydrogenase
LTEPLAGLSGSVPLAPFTTFGVGGPARWFVTAATAADVSRAHRWAASTGAPVLVLGGGSNVIVSDAGFAGLVMHVAVRGRSWTRDGEDALLSVGAGEPWDETVAECVARGLAGLECLSGIPGTVGGTPIQNVGAYGQEVAGRIDHLTVFDTEAGELRTFTAGDCAFAYRTSRFKGRDAGRFVICDVTFRLRTGPPTVSYPDVVQYLAEAGVSSPDIGDVRNAVLAVRRAKGMVIDPADADTRSVGSFFMNPVVSPADRDRVASAAGSQPPAHPADAGRLKPSAAWLIGRSGFRCGDGDGTVGISTKHTLAIVNRGGATARDVLRFAARIKRGVRDRFGISLRPEPVFVGFGRDHDLDFLQS